MSSAGHDCAELVEKLRAIDSIVLGKAERLLKEAMTRRETNEMLTNQLLYAIVGNPFAFLLRYSPKRYKHYQDQDHAYVRMYLIHNLYLPECSDPHKHICVLFLACRCWHAR